MVTRDTAWPPGTPCWIDLGVADKAKAKAFYGGLFGWSIQDGPPEAGGYSMCLIDGKAAAGIGDKQGPEEQPPYWTTYIATADADATAARVKAAGGQVLADPFDVMDVGRMAIAIDPGGAPFGIWEAKAHTGVGVANEPGALIWSENMSRNLAANQAFYRAVFGYDISDMSSDEMKYATIDIDGKPVGGIGEISAGQPAEMPATWGTYFAVADTDAAVAKVAELGGTVLAPPWDSPYGRMAVVSDDQGSVFSVMSTSGDQEG
jgi:predicted enzyme related to lactoylglutathione lyase